MAETKAIVKERKDNRGNPKGVCPATDVNTEKGDNTRYLRHALASWDLPTVDIADPKQVKERIEWYFNHCADNDMKPTVNGLSNALGVHRSTLQRWATGEVRKDTHCNLIKKAYNVLMELWEDYMVNGKINPVSGIFIGKNHFKYTDTQEVVITPNNPLGETEDPAEIRKKYIENNPELLGLTEDDESK